MLASEARIKSAILDPDPQTRQAAAGYFIQACSDDPELAPLVIQAIERYGADEAFPYYNFLMELRQTEQTCEWLIEQVRELGNRPGNQFGGERGFHYFEAVALALSYSDLAVVRPRLAEIESLGAWEEEFRANLRERLALSERTAEELWQELNEWCESTVDSDDGDEMCSLLVEALARHAEFATDKVRQLLPEPASVGLEPWLLRLAGELKLAEAAEGVVARLADTEPAIEREASYAIARIGGQAAVDELVAFYETADADGCMAAAFALGTIHTEQSAAECLRLFQKEQDLQLRCLLLYAALSSFETDAIQPALAFLRSHPLEMTFRDVRVALLDTCRITGERFPEFDDWIQADREQRENLLESLRQLEENADAEMFFDDAGFDEDQFYATPQPVVRSHEHVGRNDPCPCGSGKKFKKCCLRTRGEAARGED